SAGTLQTPNANASEEEDEAEDLIIVPKAVRQVGPRKYFTNTPEILAFRRELDDLAQNHLREVSKNKATSTNLVNSGSGIDDAQPADQDDSDMSEVTIFNKPQQGIFDEASFDDEGMVHDFNNLPTEVAVSPIPTLRIHNIHPQSQIMGDPKSSVHNSSKGTITKINSIVCLPASYLRRNLKGFLKLYKITVRLKLCKRSYYSLGCNRNKRDERGVVVRNKARLVAQGHRQEQGIDYDKVFALVARIEAIRLFLAFGLFMGFIVYQIDVKSAFLYGTIDEEVYVSQPPGFVDPDHPKKVYKKDKKDIMLVQVYVDDIIFGSTRKSWCDEFEALMKGKFQMSSMGELIFFLGLQVKQKIDGIDLADMLKKFDLTSVKTAITPMETKMALTKDEEADEVDVHFYRSMI
ncbi:retrovirus-related pol polyprotein from transposon TNT 1-94, partial [Tanacetum coccineum]